MKSIKELIENYVEEICPQCSNKESKLCNIQTYTDYSNSQICCKCIYFSK